MALHNLIILVQRIQRDAEPSTLDSFDYVLQIHAFFSFPADSSTSGSLQSVAQVASLDFAGIASLFWFS